MESREFEEIMSFKLNQTVPSRFLEKGSYQKRKYWERLMENYKVKVLSSNLTLLLFRKTSSPSLEKKQPKPAHQFKIVVKKEDLPQIFAKAHDDNGHVGRDAMLFNLSTAYSIQNMVQHVKEYLGNCERCEQRKPNPFLPAVQPIVSSSVGERVVFDITYLPLAQGKTPDLKPNQTSNAKQFKTQKKKN